MASIFYSNERKTLHILSSFILISNIESILCDRFSFIFSIYNTVETIKPYNHIVLY